MKTSCNVIGCFYVAELFIEEYGDFPACTLHDCWQVRRILDALQVPCSWVFKDRPIVTPGLALEEHHLVHRPATLIFKTENEKGLWSYADEDGTLRAENDGFLQEMLLSAEGKASTILARFDLTRSE